MSALTAPVPLLGTASQIDAGRDDGDSYTGRTGAPSEKEKWS